MTQSASAATERSRAFRPSPGPLGRRESWTSSLRSCLRIRKGVGPIRVLQGVAAGLIGRESAIKGGLATAGLGLGHPFLYCLRSWPSVFYVASRKLVFLTRHPVISGLTVWRGAFMASCIGSSCLSPTRSSALPSQRGSDRRSACTCSSIGLPIALIVRRFPALNSISQLAQASSTLNLLNDRSSRFLRQSRARDRQLARPRRGDDQGVRPARRAMRRQLHRRLRRPEQIGRRRRGQGAERSARRSNAT